MAGHVSTMLLMLAQALPSVWSEFAITRRAKGEPGHLRLTEHLYDRVEPADFSHDVLAARPGNLAVMKLEGLFWSDLGEPGRVRDLLSRLGKAPASAA
ncbi:MAG TPA: hypothetical protein VMT58_04205 [Candidatus Binataceae bacterium]|nr:hypothetical protein [Candidatus Binataceae bacterium]